MMKIASSASRITLLLLSGTLCYGTIQGIVPVENFVTFTGMVFTYYFVSVGTK